MSEKGSPLFADHPVSFHIRQTDCQSLFCSVLIPYYKGVTLACWLTTRYAFA